MKQIISIKVGTRKAEFAECRTDMLVVGRFSDVGPDEATQALDAKLGGRLGQVTTLGDFTGKPKTHALVYGEGKMAAQRVMLLGLGERKKATLDTIRRAAAAAASRAVDLKIERLALALHGSFGGLLDAAALGRAMAEGVYLGSYRYDEYVAENGNGRLGSLDVQIVDPDPARVRNLAAGVSAGIIVGRAQRYARTIANRPGNVVTPAVLAQAAQDLARGRSTVRCTVWDEKKLRAQRMGGILAVGAGSRNPPRLIVLKYTPARRPAPGLPTVALVGKAITFDSGGISLKPAQDMDQMKFDKTGGVAVLATIQALAELKAPVPVLGLIPAAENLPSGSSFRPGDIVTTYSGKTVEILNTDAEGRMILCDALAYAARQKCDVIIDIATLTGACMVALGSYKAGLMSNDDDLVAQLREAAQESGESVWHLPTGDEYAEEMKSKIADLKNAGTRWGGACTAASFLQQFVGEARWAHLDIAGMDVFLKPTEYGCVGGTGFGVRLLTTYLMNLVKEKSEG
jgi:leucyl aminopeptidase